MCSALVYMSVCGGGPWVCMHDVNVGGLARVCVCWGGGLVGRINGMLSKDLR